RQEIESTDKAVHDAHTIQKVSDRERHHEADRCADQKIGEGVPEHFPEFGIGKKLLIIGEADELWRVHQIPIGKRQPKSLYRRVKADDRIEQDRESQKAPHPDQPSCAHGKAIRQAVARRLLRRAACCSRPGYSRCHVSRSFGCGEAVPRRNFKACYLAASSTSCSVLAACSRDSLTGCFSRMTRLAMSTAVWRCFSSTTDMVVCVSSRPFRSGP